MFKSKLINSYCLDALKTFPDNYFCSVVTDPPYGLSDEPDIADVMKHWIKGDSYDHKSKGFMGKSWDSFVPNPDVWKEVYRVLKPGGYALVFSGTRTLDLMSISLRFGGFKIVNTLMWIFGSGFPKSADISKQVDKKKGTYVKGQISPNSRNSGKSPSGCYNDTVQNKTLSNPQSDEAKLWMGYGSGLKPAYEPIIVAMKSLEGTYADNALKHGVAGFNIDGCRIETDEIISNHSRSSVSAKSKGKYGDSSAQETHQTIGQQKGRFPSSIILDEESGKILDKQVGIVKSGKMKAGQLRNISKGKGGYQGNFPDVATSKETYGDEGGPSRFFYCAKASKSERNAGCEDLEKITTNDGRKKDIDNPYQRGKTLRNNNHPTVKPISLIRYLCRLVKPPKGGVILDLYAGTATTGIACHKEDIAYVLIEKDRDYCGISKKRLKHCESDFEFVDKLPDEEWIKEDIDKEIFLDEEVWNEF